MLEPVSETLRRRLLDLNLCSVSDLRACRRHVRRLTSDLPAFDSVWLDALVQIRRLTPFQARTLESARPERIHVGPFVTVDRLGAGRIGETFLARLCEGGDPCVIKVLRAPEAVSDETFERLQDLVRRVSGFDHPEIAVPKSVLHVGSEVVVVSRPVEGPRLDELLVRRGRFPAAVVLEIGRKLCDGLAALWRRDVAHGDLRAANVRLNRTGQAILVDAGVRAAIEPTITIHSGLAPDKSDGIAPELIGANAIPDARSDAYALGCLLWQLLAGRAPFPGGDPLIKLAAHQTRSIDDVRRWAPDAPAVLAEGIARLTARDRAQRPADSEQIASLWGPPRPRGRRLLAEFRRRFDAPSPSLRPARRLSAPTRWLFLALALFALSGAVVSLSDAGARSVMLEWAWSLSGSLAPRPSPKDAGAAPPEPGHIDSAPPTTLADSRPPALPAPDAHGVVHLDGPGPYRPSEITAVGPLAIIGNKAAHPVIVIDQPLKICAESVRIENVAFRAASGSAGRPPRLNALILVQAQELSIESCTLTSGEIALAAHAGKDSTAPPSGPALVAWKLLDAADPQGGSAFIRNTLLFGDGPAIYLAHAVREIGCDNVLKIGPGPLVQLAAAPRAPKSTLLRLTHTTCRTSGAVLRWVVPEPKPSPRGRVLVEAADCVFDLLPDRAGLFELAGSDPNDEWLSSLQMLGEGSVAGPGLEVAAWVSTEDGRVKPLDATSLELEGILSAPFQFAGAASYDPADSQVRDIQAPRRSGDPPGIRANALP